MRAVAATGKKTHAPPPQCSHAAQKGFRTETGPPPAPGGRPPTPPKLMTRRASMGAPARLALLLAALVACIACVAAAPAACPVAADGTTTCKDCKKKSCKFDDNCHFNTAGQAKRGVCQDLGTGLVVGATDMCSGVQRKHGKNAPVAVGGPGKKKQRCNDKSVTAPGFSTVKCECVNKKGNNKNDKGNPVKKCKRCQQSVALVPDTSAPPPPPTPTPTPTPTPSPPPSPPTPIGATPPPPTIIPVSPTPVDSDGGSGDSD